MPCQPAPLAPVAPLTRPSCSLAAPGDSTVRTQGPTSTGSERRDWQEGEADVPHVPTAAWHNPVAPPALSTPWSHTARSQHLPPALPSADNKLINKQIKLLVSLWCPKQLGKQHSTGHSDPELRNTD